LSKYFHSVCCMLFLMTFAIFQKFSMTFDFYCIVCGGSIEHITVFFEGAMLDIYFCFGLSFARKKRCSLLLSLVHDCDDTLELHFGQFYPCQVIAFYLRCFRKYQCHSHDWFLGFLELKNKLCLCCWAFQNWRIG
jgi:hypothetical protein